MAVVTARLSAGTAVKMQARQFSWRGMNLPSQARRGTDTVRTPPRGAGGLYRDHSTVVREP